MNLSPPSLRLILESGDSTQSPEPRALSKTPHREQSFGPVSTSRRCADASSSLFDACVLDNMFQCARDWACTSRAPCVLIVFLPRGPLSSGGRHRKPSREKTSHGLHRVVLLLLRSLSFSSASSSFSSASTLVAKPLERVTDLSRARLRRGHDPRQEQCRSTRRST